MTYKLSRQAKADIKEVIRYRDRHCGPAETDENIDGRYYSFDLLSDNSKMGRELSSGKRRYIYRMNNVYYRITAGGLVITQFRHSAIRQPLYFPQFP